MPMMDLFDNSAASPLDNLVSRLQNELNNRGQSFTRKESVGKILSMENMNEVDRGNLVHERESIHTFLNTIALEAFHDSGRSESKHDKLEDVYGKAQIKAATMAALVCADPKTFWSKTNNRHLAVSTEDHTAVIDVTGQIPDGMDARVLSIEAFDEIENRNASSYSVAYNLQAARQDEFGETFYPTVVVAPDQAGFAISIRLVQVYNELRRQISGALDKFQFKNIIHAVIDPTILQNDQTKVVPVYRDESKHNFVDSALVAPRDVMLDNERIPTAPLAMGKSFSLLGVSQTEALLETGLLDSTDALDSAVILQNLYISLQKPDGTGKEVVKFNTERLPTSNFTYSVQGNYRKMMLNFGADHLLVNELVKKVDGSASVLLKDLVDGKFAVRLKIKVGGDVNLQTAETNLYASEVEVARVANEAGEELPLDTGLGKNIADLFIGAKAIGYDLDARRTNLNRRQRGQLLNLDYYNQLYPVKLRAPITVPRPQTSGSENDSSDLGALITATHIRTSAAAVEELLRVRELLRDHVNSNDPIGDTAHVLGVARFLVKPVYEEHKLDVAAVVDSLKSHERAEDLQATLVNVIRDMVYRMYTDSGYKAAADALAGGVAPLPTVIIGTDPVLHRYLTVTGDLRTLGDAFNVKIVSTLNKNMAGKIVISFGDMDSGRMGTPNPMHFGNMAWKPELTLVLPTHRNGGNTKELTVQPSFLHVTNLPIMGFIEVSNISAAVFEKVAIATTPVVPGP